MAGGLSRGSSPAPIEPMYAERGNSVNEPAPETSTKMGAAVEWLVGLFGISASVWGFWRVQSVDRIVELPAAVAIPLVGAFGALLVKAFLLGGVPEWTRTPRGILWAVVTLGAFGLLLFRLPVAVVRVLLS